MLYDAPGWVNNVRVSPDGRLVAFIDHPQRGDNNGSVKVIDTAGKVRLTGPFAIRGLAWSPRGDEVWSSGQRNLGDVALREEPARLERSRSDPSWTSPATGARFSP